MRFLPAFKLVDFVPRPFHVLRGSFFAISAEVLIDEKSQELEKKNELISQKDEIFRDKSARVSFLESEIESLQVGFNIYLDWKIRTDICIIAIIEIDFLIL